MSNLTQIIETELYSLGADLVGFGDLSELPVEVRADMPFGISVVVVYQPEVIRGITNLPTQEYRECYDKLNERLDTLVMKGAELLRNMGYQAIAQTRKYVGSGETSNNTTLPHKTVATRAGIGWIGKSALFVTEKYGSAIRLSSILTNAPLETALPVNESRCGDCMICANACPANAVSGKQWDVSLYRDEFFDLLKCQKAARERSKLGFSGDITICDKCIEICPYTQRYINPKRGDSNI